MHAAHQLRALDRWHHLQLRDGRHFPTRVCFLARECVGGGHRQTKTRGEVVIGHHHARSWYAPRRARVTSTTELTRSATTGALAYYLLTRLLTPLLTPLPTTYLQALLQSQLLTHGELDKQHQCLTQAREGGGQEQGVEDSGHQAEGALRLLRPGSTPLGVTRRARAEHHLGTPQRRNTTTGTPLKVSILNWAPRAQASRNCVTHVSWSVPSLVIYRSLSYDEDDVMVLI